MVEWEVSAMNGQEMPETSRYAADVCSTYTGATRNLLTEDLVQDIFEFEKAKFKLNTTYRGFTLTHFELEKAKFKSNSTYRGFSTYILNSRKQIQIKFYIRKIQFNPF